MDSCLYQDLAILVHEVKNKICPKYIAELVQRSEKKPHAKYRVFLLLKN